MKKSKLIALSAVSTAFATIFLVMGAYISVFEYSGIFMASLCMMIPLTKKSVWAGLMTYMATALLCLLFIGGRWVIAITFAMFFGLHPLANYFFENKKIKWVIALPIKEVWFLGTLLFLYFFFQEFVAFEFEWAQKYALPILLIGGGLLFIAYDFIMIRFQRYLDIIVKKLKL